MEDMKLLEAPEERKLLNHQPEQSSTANAACVVPDVPLSMDTQSQRSSVRGCPKTLKQYMAERKDRKVRMSQRPTIRQKIAALAKDMRDAEIPYKTPRQLYGKRYTQKMWSGYFSYLCETARRAV